MNFNHKNIIKSLFSGALVCTIFLVGRIIYTNNFTYLFLVWNLFLAWVPLILALIALQIDRFRNRLFKYFLYFVIGSVWLLFFPNAPYLITDFVHLHPGQHPGYWFDLFLLFWFAFAGLSAGMLSLYWMHQVTAKLFNNISGWIFVFGSVLLSGYGVYLGRIQRWNSWDIFTDPRSLLMDTIGQLGNQTAQIITIVFGVLIISAYFIFLSLINHQTSAAKSKINRE